MSISQNEMLKGLVPKPNRKSRRMMARELLKTNAAASYARFSSDHQDQSSNVDQQRACRTKAASNSHVIADEREYSDEEVSGTKRDRNGLNSLLADAKVGKFAAIYFFSLSRLARQSLISMSILKKLVHVYHIRIISVSEGIDSNQTGWEMAAQIVSMFHEQFIKELAANVFRGQEGALLENYAVGDHRFGFRTIAAPGATSRGRGKSRKPPRVYVIDTDQAKWVVAIFTWFVVKQYSISRIVKLLNNRRVSKGHRRQIDSWSRANVISILESCKYVGVWPWGLMKNMRDPETGKVWQEPREEIEKSEHWIRYRKDLQIVDLELFKKAQKRLQKNRDAIASSRNEVGRFQGDRGSRGNPPRHLLSNLIFCGQCGHRFYIGGANGKYLFCPKNREGTCKCRTFLPKKLATNLVLEIVVNAIMNDAAWLDRTHQAVHAAWEQNHATIPGEIISTERLLAATEQKVSRLIDLVENGKSDIAIGRRLEERQQECRHLALRLQELRNSKLEKPEAPTMEWVCSQLQDLIKNLPDLSPSTIDALHRLLGGRIVVEEVTSESSRRYLRGRLTLCVNDASKLILQQGDNPIDHSDQTENAAAPIFVDFKEQSPLEARAEMAKELYDQGLMNAEISNRLGVSKSMITKLIRYWFESRGQVMPDGRARRSSLERKHLDQPYYQQISGRVHEMLGQGLLLQDIASRIDCDRNTITSAARYWDESRGLKYQDGRERRKSLNRKLSD